jgi:hypothetical protein
MAFNLATAYTQLDARRGRSSGQTIDKVVGRLRDLASGGGSPSGALQAGFPAGTPGMGQQFQYTALAGLAGKMQQEAARQDSDRQFLLAQQEANQHLGALAGAAAGSGLRVQVVGTQPAQW